MEQLIKALAEKKVLHGFREVRRALVAGNLQKIYIVTNCLSKYKIELKNLAKLADVEIVELPINAEQLSSQLKLGFKPTVLGIIKT
ncbi:MAG: hypothetical protein ACP5IJ_01575 [Candidatus Nanoarchaeia archaeon]